MVYLGKRKVFKLLSVFLCIFFISSYVVGEDTLLLLDDEDAVLTSSSPGSFKNVKKYKIDVPCYGKVAFTASAEVPSGSNMRMKKFVPGGGGTTVLKTLTGGAPIQNIHEEMYVDPGIHFIYLDTNGTANFKSFKAEFLEATFPYATTSTAGNIPRYHFSAHLVIAVKGGIMPAAGGGFGAAVLPAVFDMYYPYDPETNVFASIWRGYEDMNILGVEWNFPDISPTTTWNAMGGINKNVFVTELCDTHHDILDVVITDGPMGPIARIVKPFDAEDWPQEDTLKLVMDGPVDWSTDIGGINCITMRCRGYILINRGTPTEYLVEVEGKCFLTYYDSTPIFAPYDLPPEDDNCGYIGPVFP